MSHRNHSLSRPACHGCRYRFRYDEYSPESAYSPIAGVKRCRKPSTVPDSHVFSSHVDADGAVCSHPVVGPLALVVRTSDGHDLTVHVRYTSHKWMSIWTTTCPNEIIVAMHRIRAYVIV